MQCDFYFVNEAVKLVHSSLIQMRKLGLIQYVVKQKNTWGVVLLHHTFFSWLESTPSRSISACELLRARRACFRSACTSSMRVAMAASLVAVSCSRFSSRHSPSAAARFWLLTESANAFIQRKKNLMKGQKEVEQQQRCY